MVRKNYSRTGATCRVTFDLPAIGEIEKASLCGDFNEWNPNANPMKRRKGGRYSTTISLKSGQSYRFKYLLDGRSWENDWNADRYVPNCFGSDDSQVRL
jgi:1,4-alpha-glucan branching enzyme